MYTLISFYTQNWQYPAKAERLRQACQKLGIDCLIEELPDAGNWTANTRLKSKFVYDKLIELQRPVVWVDADCVLHKAPEVDLTCDIGAVKKAQPNPLVWYVSILFFNYTSKGIEFARRWAQYPLKSTDHAAFEKVWREGFDGKVQEFSRHYCESKPNENTVMQLVLSKDASKQKCLKRL